MKKKLFSIYYTFDFHTNIFTPVHGDEKVKSHLQLLKTF